MERRTGKNKCLAYDEHEKIVLDELSKDDTIIPLVSIEGIKFTSRSFDIEVKVAQVMRLDQVSAPYVTLSEAGKRRRSHPIQQI